MSNLEQETENPILKEIVHKDSPLKEMILQYVGQTFNPKDDEVTVEMIVDIMATEFPEFVLVLAEENFIRGYEQAISDVISSETPESDIQKFKEHEQQLRLVTDNEDQE
tara:strand:- start:1133 stop:1459 length:327 start_codon:yes stop_codon:yes gene_type:complete